MTTPTNNPSSSSEPDAPKSGQGEIMSTEFISEVSPDRLNALVKNIMRQTGITDPREAVQLVNSGEWVVSEVIRPWRKQENVIYFSITSDGTPGEEWVVRLKDKGFDMGEREKRILRSNAFRPTCAITTEVAVLKGILFADNGRITRNIRAEAGTRKLQGPNVEAACLIREKFADNQEIRAMGLRSIVVMHKPIAIGGGLNLLGTYIDSLYGFGINAYCGDPNYEWDRRDGFAFAVSSQS